jgi:hypothetical protein
VLRERAQIESSSKEKKNRDRNDTKDLDEQLRTGISQTMTAGVGAQLPTTNGHINFFEDLETQVRCCLTVLLPQNVEHASRTQWQPYPRRRPNTRQSQLQKPRKVSRWRLRRKICDHGTLQTTEQRMRLPWKSFQKTEGMYNCNQESRCS